MRIEDLTVGIKDLRVSIQELGFRSEDSLSDWFTRLPGLLVTREHDSVKPTAC